MIDASMRDGARSVYTSPTRRSASSGLSADEDAALAYQPPRSCVSRLLEGCATTSGWCICRRRAQRLGSAQMP